MNHQDHYYLAFPNQTKHAGVSFGLPRAMHSNQLHNQQVVPQQPTLLRAMYGIFETHKPARQYTNIQTL